MAVQNDSGVMTFAAAIALTRGRGVSLAAAAGEVEYPAAETEEIVGVTLEDAIAGEHVAVALLSKPGTVKVQASQAITAPTSGKGTPLYVGTDGRFTDVAGTQIRYYALEAVGAAGEYLEAMVAGSGE